MDLNFVRIILLFPFALNVDKSFSDRLREEKAISYV